MIQRIKDYFKGMTFLQAMQLPCFIISLFCLFSFFFTNAFAETVDDFSSSDQIEEEVPLDDEEEVTSDEEIESLDEEFSSDEEIESLEEDFPVDEEEIPIDDEEVSSGEDVQVLEDIYTLMSESPVFQAETFSISSGLDSGFYFEGSVQGLGSCKIFIPASFCDDSISTDNTGSLVNMSGSTINGIIVDSSGDMYNLSWSTWSDPRYRVYDSGYTWNDTSISLISEGNVKIYDQGEYPSYLGNTELYLLITCIFSGVILVWSFIRH